MNMIAEKEGKNEKYKNEDKLKARGKTKMVETLNKVKARHDKIEQLLNGNANLNETFDIIVEKARLSTTTSFKAERQESRFQEDLENEEKRGNRQPNKAERETGVEFTPTVCGRIRFFDAKAAFKDGIVEELKARNFNDFPSLRTFTDFKNKLRELVAIAEGEKDEKKVKDFPILSSYDWSSQLQTSSSLE